jgi:hypothetical protein
MGRKVQIRANYRNDARFLLRVIEAIEKDQTGRLTRQEKKDVISSLQYAAQTMIGVKEEEDADARSAK